jgi:hypothetical protein
MRLGSVAAGFEAALNRKCTVSYCDNYTCRHSKLSKQGVCHLARIFVDGALTSRSRGNGLESCVVIKRRGTIRRCRVSIDASDTLSGTHESTCNLSFRT